MLQLKDADQASEALSYQLLQKLLATLPVSQLEARQNEFIPENCCGSAVELQVH
jgi:hypothetical protein